MSDMEDVTLGEITRGMSGLSEQIHRLHEETMNQHHRVRNDMAASLGAIQNDIRSIIGDSKAHDERLHSHGREIGALTKRVETTEAQMSKLLWAIIGAYGAVTLAVLGVALSSATR